MRKAIPCSAISMAVLAARIAAAEPAFDPVLVQLGAPLYVQHCASCHGREGRGDGPAAPALTRRPADLTAIAARRGGAFPAAEIARFIDGRFELPAHGSREMPVWGERFGEEVPDPEIKDSIARGNIACLVEYLKSIQR
jgi:mono/diheme cytochrome c family protein